MVDEPLSISDDEYETTCNVLMRLWHHADPFDQQDIETVRFLVDKAKGVEGRAYGFS